MLDKRKNNLIKLIATILLFIFIINVEATNTFATDFGFGSASGFYTLQEVYDQLDNMREKYPHLITEKESLGTTHEGRPLYMVKISDNPQNDEDEPEVFYNALIHGNEKLSMEVVVYYMYYLLENYETDPVAKYIVDNRELYFMPVVNPDGYMQGQRKNRRNNGDGTYGVDLNRNFGPQAYWNYDNTGSSDSTSNSSYRGPAPFSEPETQAIESFLTNHNIRTAVNYHTTGGQVIFPYSAAEAATPDDAVFKEWAEDMARSNYYMIGKTIDTAAYETRGDVLDYMYDTVFSENQERVYPFIIEAGFDSGLPLTQARILPVAEENLYANHYLALIAGGFVDTVSLSVHDIPFNPGKNISASLSVKNKGLEDTSGTTAILRTTSPYISIKDGKEDIPEVDSNENLDLEDAFKFRVSEDAPLNTRIDFTVTISINGLPVSSKTYTYYTGTENYYLFDKCNTLDNWTTTNTQTARWEITTDTYHSAPSSCTDSKTGVYTHQNKLNNAIVSNTIDLRNTTAPRLSFWTKYAMYTSLDYGRVQISTDGGNTWVNLTTMHTKEGIPYNRATGPLFTGTNTTWTKEEIDLSAYVEQQIKLKFLFTSFLQSETISEFYDLRSRDGWYLDDIKVFEYFKKEKESKSDDDDKNDNDNDDDDKTTQTQESKNEVKQTVNPLGLISTENIPSQKEEEVSPVNETNSNPTLGTPVNLSEPTPAEPQKKSFAAHIANTFYALTSKIVDLFKAIFH